MDDDGIGLDGRTAMRAWLDEHVWRDPCGKVVDELHSHANPHGNARLLYPCA
jgi:hypothetical protein